MEEKSIRDKTLEMLKANGGYISGEEIGRTLGVSRSAVWKAVSSLKKNGYSIASSTNRGYMLMDGDVMSAEELADGLSSRIIGRKIYFYPEVDSTNSELKRLAAAGEPEGAVAVAEVQTLGRGRLGRSWSSAKGSGIWFSFLLRPDISPVHASMLTLIAGLSVCRAVRNYTGLEAEIKWPNDVLIKGKKICGILTEMNAEMDSINYIVVGIGVNVNNEEFPPEIMEKATSLCIEGGRKYKRSPLAREIILEYEKRYVNYVKSESFSEFLAEYKSMCATLGQEISVIGKNGFDGRAVDITDGGELVVEKETGERTVVFSGEVSIRKKEAGLYNGK